MRTSTAANGDARAARRLRRRIKDGRRFISERARKSMERQQRVRHALEYLVSPGDPDLYPDHEAMTEALVTLRRTR